MSKFSSLGQLLKKRGTYIVTYSGVSTIGRNSYLVIKDGRILVIDFGVGFPDIDAYNIQYILPDVQLLGRYAKYIDAIVITHAHMDHVGGVSFLLKHFRKEVPVFGSRFTIKFLQERLKEVRDLKALPRLHVVDSSRQYKVGSFHVEFAHVTHSIPQSMAVAVNTAYGKIVYTGDFKLDPTPINEAPTDVNTLRRWSREGILLTLADSTNTFEKGHSRSETTIMGVLEEIIEEARGRVIVGMFSSLVSRLIGIVEIAKKLNKKVAFTGRSLETNVKIAMQIGYLTPDQDTIIPIEDTHKYDDKQLIIIATGSQGEYEAALMKMARSKHEYIRLRSTDTIILSSSVIPTNVVSVQRLMDMLSHTGATLINNKLMDVHVSGHAYQEDLKEMARLLDSKYYVPVHGYPSFLSQHKKLLQEMGVPGGRVLLPSEGSVFELSDNKVTTLKKLKLIPQYVVAGQLLDKSDPLVLDRTELGYNGVLSVFIKTGNVPQVRLSQRGVAPYKLWQELRPLLKKSVINFLMQLSVSQRKNLSANKELKIGLVKLITKRVYRDLKVKPVVVINVL